MRIPLVLLLLLTFGAAPVRAQTVVPAGPLALETAVALALAQSPRLAALAKRVSAREGALEQARLLPNPELRAELEDFGGGDPQDGFDSSQTTLMLLQPIETAGKRRYRTALADRERALARLDLEAARIDAEAAAKRAFFAALALQERLSLTDERVRLAGESVAAVNALVEAGGASPVETMRARVELGQIQLTRTDLARRLGAARANLAATWGSRDASFGGLSGDFGATSAPPASQSLFERLEQSPRLARWPAELAERRAAFALERARRVPDLVAGVGGRRYAETNSAAFVAELSIPLPVFGRNQGGIAEAGARIEEADFERAQAGAEAHAALATAYEVLASAYGRAASLRDEIIPQAEDAYDGARRGHRQGFFRFTDVLDAQRTLFELRDSRLETLADYHLARTEIEAWIGGPLEVAP